MVWLVGHQRSVLLSFATLALCGLVWGAFHSGELAFFGLAGLIGGALVALFVLGFHRVVNPFFRGFLALLMCGIVSVFGLLAALIISVQPAQMNPEEALIGFEAGLGMSAVAFLFWRSYAVQRLPRDRSP